MLPGFTLIERWLSPDDERSLLVDLPPVSRQPDGGLLGGYGVTAIWPGSFARAAVAVWWASGISPNTVTARMYAAGDRLAPHVDADEAGDVVCVASLMSGADMHLSRCTVLGPEHWISDIKVHLPRYSLAIMRGAARRDYSHEILPHAAPRVSLVFFERPV